MHKHSMSCSNTQFGNPERKVEIPAILYTFRHSFLRLNRHGGRGSIIVDFPAKKKRQIIMVTHNPNLAILADAEQIIYMNIVAVSCQHKNLDPISRCRNIRLY